MSFDSMDFETKALHIGQEPDEGAHAIVPPLYLSSTFTQAGLYGSPEYEYSRVGNPNRDQLERCLTALEGGVAGACYSTGVAAVMAVLHSLKPGDDVIAGNNLYGGTWRAMEQMFRPWGLNIHYAASDKAEDYAKVIESVTSPRLLWVESPTNPMLNITDLSAIAKMRDGIEGCQMVVDNTFATPALQRPFEFGADIVLHSLTKFLGGHSDVLGGAVIVRNLEDIEPYRCYQKTAGAVLAPFDCWLVQRGLKTLALRMERHCHNAMALAEHLNVLTDFSKVLYPGLPDFPDHELAKKQMASNHGTANPVGGFGAVVTVEFKDKTRVPSFLENLKIFSLAEGLGGVESMVGYPAIMSHGSLTKEDRERIGISDGMIRFSVGIEKIGDLIEDIEQALKSC